MCSSDLGGCNHAWARRPKLALRGFNPHPPRRAGATRKAVRVSRGSARFQSSPAPKGGCNGHRSHTNHHPLSVSILTRPEGRVQRSPHSQHALSPSSFNPHPPRRAGATPQSRRLHALLQCRFNPHPPRRAGATLASCSGLARVAGFNPHPPRRAGATMTISDVSAVALRFQSSPAPKGGCNLDVAAWGARAPEFQSSPAPKGGCNARRERRNACMSSTLFQSSPAPKGGCNKQ